MKPIPGGPADQNVLFVPATNGVPFFWIWLVVDDLDYVFKLARDRPAALTLADELRARIAADQSVDQLVDWLVLTHGLAQASRRGPVCLLTNFLVSTRKRGAGRRHTLFHPRNAEGVESKLWATRIPMGKDRVVFSLCLNHDLAVALDNEARAMVRDDFSREEIDAYLLRTREGEERYVAPKGRPGVLRLRAIVDRHAKITPANASRKTWAGYRRSLCRALEVEYRARHRQPPPPRRHGFRLSKYSYLRYLDQPYTVLTPAWVERYIKARLEGVVPDSDHYDCAAKSINSELTNLRAVFCAEASEVFASAGMTLEGMDPFLLHPGAPVQRSHRRKVDEVEAGNVLDAFFALLAKPDPTEAELILVIIVGLALLGGLRPSEVCHAHTDQLSSMAGPAINVVCRDPFIPKFGKERSVRLVDWFFQFLATRPPGYLLGSEVPTVRRRLMYGARGWLRRHGLKHCRRPVHRLRAYRAAYLLCRLAPDFDAVARQLGHYNIRVTFTSYSRTALTEPMADRCDVTPLFAGRFLT